MANKVLKVDRELTEEVEKTQYEVMAAKDILTHVYSSTGSIIPKERLEILEARHLEKVIAYEKAKAKVEAFVQSNTVNPVSWNLDFSTSEVTVVL